MESERVEANVNKRDSIKYIDEDTTSVQYLDVSTNNELLIVNNVCVAVDSARERQEESISVESSACEEQIALLNDGERTVVVERSKQHVTKELLCYGRVLIFLANLSKEQADGFSKVSRVRTYCALLITIIFSVLDVGTDVWLMFKYFLGGQYLYGTLTMVFVWVPALFNTIELYEICSRNKKTWLYQIQNKKWPFIIIYIIPIASAVAALNNLILLWKTKIDKEDSRKQTEHLLELQMGDSYLEALPQLTLQLSIILNNVENETLDTSFLNMLRWGSMAFSVFTVARVTYSAATNNSDNIVDKEAATQFISTILLIGSRVFVVSMGFVVSPAVTGVCLSIHWIGTAVARYREDREEKYTVTESIHGSVLDATVCIFYYVVGACLSRLSSGGSQFALNQLKTTV